jgi:CRISPR/Cas system CMR-associated protein Cmr3 (group 5 of RAMP superfamily)
LRTALLSAADLLPSDKAVDGKKNRRSGSTEYRRLGSKAFSSLTTVGPFPWRPDTGPLFPIPGHIVSIKENVVKSLYLHLTNSGLTPPLKALPVSPIPPSKTKPKGWWNIAQLLAYLESKATDFTPLTDSCLWQPEYRVGIEIETQSQTAKQGQLYSGSYLRMNDSKGAAFFAKRNYTMQSMWNIPHWKI